MKHGNRIQVHVYLTEEEFERLVRHCNMLNRSRSTWVRELINKNCHLGEKDGR